MANNNFTTIDMLMIRSENSKILNFVENFSGDNKIENIVSKQCLKYRELVGKHHWHLFIVIVIDLIDSIIA